MGPDPTSSDQNCTDCKYLQTRQICGHQSSPFYGKKVSSDDRCEFLVVNPAVELFLCGMKMAFGKGSEALAIPYYEAALKGYLPEDDAMAVHFFLAQAYFEIVCNSGLSRQEMVARPEFSRAIREAETSIQIDQTGKYGYFAEPINRARLYKLGALYGLSARTIEEKDGTIKAISYLEGKLDRGCPLIRRK